MPLIPAPKRRTIAEHWLELTLRTYPAQSAQFMVREKDPFRNPLGHALQEGLPALLDLLLDGMDPVKADKTLEPMVRIRAVQDFSPGEAVGFVLLLKKVLDREFPEGWRDELALEERIDQMLLLAFGVFMRCREKIYEVRVEEGKRRGAVLERMYSTVKGGDSF